MNIIFLDFDGVLRPTRYTEACMGIWQEEKQCSVKDQYGFYFAPWAMDALNYIIAAADANIVFTTDWRKNGFEQIKELWVQRGYRFPNRIIGQTPVLDNANRGKEITAWLMNHKKKITSYVILDDCTKMGKEHEGRLVPIDERWGLRMSHANDAVEILTKKYKPLKLEDI
jgi:HAD domain in Swiss Army Knife RNA repair proteins